MADPRRLQRRRQLKSAPDIIQAPMALTSAGDLLFNIAQIRDETDPHELIDAVGARQVFIGVVVPQQRLANVVAQIDNASAEIAGITEAPFIRSGGGTDSASDQSSAGQRSARQDPPERQAPRPRGRRRGP